MCFTFIRVHIYRTRTYVTIVEYKWVFDSILQYIILLYRLNFITHAPQHTVPYSIYPPLPTTRIGSIFRGSSAVCIIICYTLDVLDFERAEDSYWFYYLYILYNPTPPLSFVKLTTPEISSRSINDETRVLFSRYLGIYSWRVVGQVGVVFFLSAGISVRNNCRRQFFELHLTSRRVRVSVFKKLFVLMRIKIALTRGGTAR